MSSLSHESGNAAAREAFEEAVERGGYAHAFKWRMAALLMAEVKKTWMAPIAQVLEAGGALHLAAARAKLERLRQYHLRQLVSERSRQQESNSPEAHRLGELEATVRAQVISALQQLCDVELPEEPRGARRR